MLKTFKDFIELLKDPKEIDLKEVRVYNATTPSVTGLLSLLKYFIPKDDKALARWTKVHKYMEDALSGKKISIDDNSDIQWYVQSAMPFIRKLKGHPESRDIVLLEEKLEIPWVFWWTIDYIKKFDKKKIADLIDFKTIKKLGTLGKELTFKYYLQLRFYSILITSIKKWRINSMKLSMIAEDAYEEISLNLNNTSLNMSVILLTLVIYYHGLNKTLDSKELSTYIIDNWYLGTLKMIARDSKNHIPMMESASDKLKLNTLIEYSEFLIHKITPPRAESLSNNPSFR